MPVLSQEQHDEVGTTFMRAMSRDHVLLPVTKPEELRALIDVFDSHADACEQAILDALPAGARAWLVANQAIARQLLEDVVAKRKDVL